MESLMAWVREKIPASDETTLIHGDFRIDNLMFGTESPPRAIAVLDWELSTLGHPISEVAYACMAYHLNLPGRGGLAGTDVASLGIPTQQELVDAYCAKTGRAKIDHFPYFMAFGIFRLAAIAQGVYKRSLQGNASSEDAGAYGTAVATLSDLACSIAGIATR
jgi:aminoglycoside phosphotransferase (APT) family kinase protein